MVAVAERLLRRPVEPIFAGSIPVGHPSYFEYRTEITQSRNVYAMRNVGFLAKPIVNGYEGL